MPGKKIKEFLDRYKIKYQTIHHPVAYCAKEVSHVCNLSEGELAKTVIVYAGNKMVMIVLPSNEIINFEYLRHLLHENDIMLAPENEFSRMFPDCEVGAMPPFGNLYNMEVFISQELTKQDEIAFNAGTHTEIIKLPYKDFSRLVRPRVLTIH